MGLLETKNLQHFYINEEQSFYLLSHQDAQKLKDWLDLCQSQLDRLGYRDIEMVGKGAYGFVFSGTHQGGQQYVFKFSRITLPQYIQDRLEEEGFMLNQLEHSGIPKFIEFQNINSQSILMMERAPGINLEQLSRQMGKLAPRLMLKIAAQMSNVLLYLRRATETSGGSVVVHGDIKPSNIMFDSSTETISLIDWGAAVFSQCDAQNQRIDGIGLDAFNSDFSKTNAKLGDIYFVGDDQLRGALSSPRFDEQGLAGTLYALASGQGSRFGHHVITPESLGLPIEFAKTLAGMLDEDSQVRAKAGDYFLNNMRYMKHIVSTPRVKPPNPNTPLIPFVLTRTSSKEPTETVVYSSRKSFLREEIGAEKFDAQAAHEVHSGDYGHYKNYLSGMGDTEKAFIIAVSHLGGYPVVGGLAINWNDGGVYIDSSLNLYDASLAPALVNAINNVVHLARAISNKGLFKSCMFDARKTLHISRENSDQPFIPQPGMEIQFDYNDGMIPEDDSKLHSYFEDGADPDERLQLPQTIMKVLAQMNKIQHTGCIIFEAVQQDLKIHNYLRLLDVNRKSEFRECLDQILLNIPTIEGLGVSGFMKLPYKNTKFFSRKERQDDSFLAK